MNRRTLLTAAVAPLIGCRQADEAGQPSLAFIAVDEEPAVVVLDLRTFRVERRIPLPDAPVEILCPAGGRTAYVLSARTGTLHEIDRMSLAIAKTTNVATAADAMRLAPANAAPGLWVLAATQRQLVRVSPARQIERTLALESGAFDFDVASYLPLAAVSYGTSGKIGLYSTQTGKLQTLVPVSASVGLARFQTNGEQLLVANLADQCLTVIRSSDGRIVTHLPLALKPEYFCMSADGGQLYITGGDSDAVVIVAPYQTQITATVLAGHQPRAMAVAAGSPYLLLANSAAGRVSLLDGVTHRVVASTVVGGNPRGIVITPNGQYALVLNYDSGDLAIIRLDTLRPTRAKTAGLLTMIPLGGRPVAAAVMSGSAPV